jgi:peptidoglycan/xylan/chitin deacetylase (PgdA/CDA1 family)
MRRSLKRLVERALASPVAMAMRRQPSPDDVIVLAYHNVVPNGQAGGRGDGSLHLSQESFSQQLDLLTKTHVVVPLSEIFDPVQSGRPRRVAITLDDAYAGALTTGVDELVRRGLPATIFVAPGLLGHQPWWDLLGAAGLLSSENRQFALDALRGDADLVTEWARTLPGFHDRAPDYRVGTEASVLAAATRPGITLGSHTWSHRNLTTLSIPDIELEFSRALAWLTERFGAGPHTVSYPYGLHSPQVVLGAARAGHAAAFRVDGGPLRADARRSPFALPRVNIPAGLSLDGFRLRLTGFGPR